MVAVQGDRIVAVPIEEVGGRTKTVPLDSALLDVATSVGTSMGVDR
jgi:hypothetical protein